jgi:hypothetical protein
MKKLAIIASLLLVAGPAFATVTVGTQTTSLVTSPVTLSASSSPLGLFTFALTGDAAETLTSVALTLMPGSGSTVTGSDLAQVAVYKDANSNGTFESGTDTLAGSQTSVNVGTPTTIAVSSNNSLTGGARFFVTLSTGASWSGVAPADSLTARIPASGIVTSTTSPTVTEVTTSSISAVAPVVVDTTGPVLTTAVMQTGTTKNVTLTFGEATNKPVITAANINTVLALSNSHSWLNGASLLGSAVWNTEGKTLVVTVAAPAAAPVTTLEDNTNHTVVPVVGAPTVAVGDVVTIAGGVIKDAVGNNATGSATITAATTGGHGGDDEDGDEDEHEGMPCANTLINGRLYKLAGDANPTVYLAAACTLRPFRGAAVFHARGNKFQNIIVLQSLAGLDVSAKPALPADGTLIKGSDKTVWFVETGKKRKGFASEKAFLGLGFKFSQVNQISDSDLNTMEVDSTPIVSDTAHPDGAVVKCGNSNTVFQVNGTQGMPFANVDSFTLRGHTFEQVATIDCGKFHYVLGLAVVE